MGINSTKTRSQQIGKLQIEKMASLSCLARKQHLVISASMKSLIDGRIMIELVDGPIPIDRIRAFVFRDVTCGGIATFEGVTRLESDALHGRLCHLFYEAYAEMAVEKMYDLAANAMSTWGLGPVAVVHRLGPVKPGEASVCIMVSAGHRGEAFDACKWLIDKLKREVPIWKKDLFEDGFTKWVEGNATRNSKVEKQ